jgi:putative transposase
MARKPREESPGAVHHVFARGNDRIDIYRDDHDRRLYLALLERVVLRQRWSCLAYCLMDNHVHLLIETPIANLAAGMQLLHGMYAQSFNRRHRRSGHVFGGRYGGVPVKTDAQLVMVARYIARNPIEAGLRADPAAWPWSSHAATLAAGGPPWLDHPRLLAHFGADGGDARRRYADLVALR